ncbi:MAG: hypothetical protein KGJ09_10730, partial [Candidatus Omnitrophica bacterium]|nr:hypothetical protein [Candidatus Omnitrophota bacterium]MDE2215509.1 hypothetical protein [Candidatus Omnitrophota bacterium]
LHGPPEGRNRQWSLTTMNNFQTKRRSHLTGRKLAPDWSTYYQLGAEAARGMPVRMTFPEIGRALGLKVSTAQATAYVALGKLVHRCRQSIKLL